MALFGRPSAEDEQRAQAWGGWLRERDPLAIASLVLGIISFAEFGALLVFGIASIGLGFIAIRRIPVIGPPFGRRMASIGIGLSVVSLVVAAVLYLVVRH